MVEKKFLEIYQKIQTFYQKVYKTLFVCGCAERYYNIII